MSAARLFMRFYFCSFPILHSRCMYVNDTRKKQNTKIQLHSTIECEEVNDLISPKYLRNTGEEKNRSTG